MNRFHPPVGRRFRASLFGFALFFLPVVLIGCAAPHPEPLSADQVLGSTAQTRAELLTRLETLVSNPPSFVPPSPVPVEDSEDMDAGHADEDSDHHDDEGSDHHADEGPGGHAEGAPVASAAFAVDPATAALVALAVENNPDLLVARAHLAATEAEARLAGIPADPSLSFDVLHVLEAAAETPWLIGGGLELPFGALVLWSPERRAAMAELEAERASLAVEELRVRANFVEVLVELNEKRAEVILREQFAERLGSIIPVIVALSDAGEIRQAEAQTFQLERAQNDRALELARTDVVRVAGELGRIVGLPGAVPEDFPVQDFVTSHGSTTFSLDEAHSCPPEEFRSRLASSPNVRNREMEYLAATAELALERRAVFADMSAGPASEYEEGSWHAGVGASVTVPLWNRNRAAIAGARARVAAARVAWESELRDVSARLDIRLADAAALRADHERLKSDLAPMARGQLENVKKLAELGDLDVFLLLDALVRMRDVDHDLVHVRAALERVRYENMLGGCPDGC